MKKLLVVLAVLFASVSAYAVDDNEGTGSVTVNVICPLTVSNGGAIAFDNVPVGATYMPTEADNYLEFNVEGCSDETPDAAWGSNVVITYVMAPVNPVNGVTLDGVWTFDAAPAVATAVPFDGKIVVKWTVTNIAVTPDVVIHASDTEAEYTGTVTANWETI